MNSREKILKVFNRNGQGEGCLWTGHLAPKTIEIYSKKWNIEPDADVIAEYLNDDCRWVMADSGYKNALKYQPFDPEQGVKRESLSCAGCFSNAETENDIKNYPWPNVDDLDFTEHYARIDKFQDKAVFTGMWSPFFHIIADFFGLENYFVNMYENPEIVDAVTERVVQYFVDANEKFFKGLGDRADTMFFGNDFGTQQDLFISLENFRRFHLPSIKKIIAIGKKYNKKIMMHSCGSIYRIIPDLIDAGVDIIHPLQAQANKMSAVDLVQYKNDLSFVGGIDAQSFFVNATPSEIKEEVRRVKSILGPNLVVSTSHEEILPNVPCENLKALAEEALK